MQNLSFLKDRKRLKPYIEFIFKKEKKKLLKLNYIFCSDEYLLEINQQYLKHDFYTDIITFNLSENSDIVGEVYISVDRLKENAKVFNSSYLDELNRLLFHGVLHLCGYKDKRSDEKKLMSEKENFYINKYKHPHSS